MASGYVPRIMHYPGALEHNENPLSLALFSMVASFVTYPMQSACSEAVTMMYVDDVIIFLPRKGTSSCVGTMLPVLEQTRHFWGQGHQHLDNG